MHSERRRQRVRHEAGDYVPSCPKEESQPRHTSSHRESAKIAEETTKLYKAPVQEEVTPRTATLPYERKTFSPLPSEKNGFPRREDRRRPDHHYKEERRYDYNRRMDRGRGRGRGGPISPAAGRPRQDTNVAVAEEQREYEPVRIMESKEDTPKEVPELPEPPKYRRREVISNWLRYEEMPPEEEELQDGEDYLLGEDFSHVISVSGNASAGGFLHLRGEMSWGTPDISQLDRHGLGALKVADLLAALATIPLHEQLKIPENALPVSTISTMKADAERNRRNFRPDQEYVTDLEINLKVLETLKLGLQPPRGRPEEEDEPTTARDAVGAAMMLSSAEGVDPDMEVDLEDLVRGTEPSHSREPSERRSPAPPRASPAPSAVPPKAEKRDETRLPSPTPPKPTTGFDFGLAKTTGVPAGGGTTQPQPPTKTKKAKSKQPKEPTIDLDQPPPTTKKLPVLVSKTEVENLEDWLDSVLDD